MYDIAIIGGGINGCGIAREAAGRGYSVFLAEKNDLASGTSSGATKLIHGGLRYLEHYEFRLVREALTEREILWSIAPHIISPLRLVLPHHRGLRPAWLLRLGLFLYDHIGGRKRLPATRVVDLKKDQAGKVLRPEFRKAFEFSDCSVDDARLVALNARDAADRGATIRTRTTVTKAQKHDNHWQLTTRGADGSGSSDIEARMVVNASGPWVDDVLGNVFEQNAPRNVRLVQGSHIVVRQLFAHDRAYFFQNSDGRVFFAIPYEGEFTLIGTTDRELSTSPDDVSITSEEIDYLCKAVSEYFRKPVTLDEVVWTYSAVRSLYDDGAGKAQHVTRDYVLKLEDTPDEPALLNIFGGKITTYRRLAEDAVELIVGAGGMAQVEARDIGSWTGVSPLPGGNFPLNGKDNLTANIMQSHPFIKPELARRLVGAYGTIAMEILKGVKSETDMGFHFGAGLYLREVEHLIRREWARTANDILWRRSKLGLRFSPKETNHLTEWLETNLEATLAAA